MLLLPSPAGPAYNVITTIDGVNYELVYTYDEHRDLWRFGVDSLSGDPVMGHRPLLPFVQMRPNAFASALEGVFALIAPLPAGDAYDALTEGLWSVVYGLPAEVAELANSFELIEPEREPEPDPIPPDPVDWDGDYTTLPNLVAGWLPDRGLYKDAEGTDPAGEGDDVLGWRDFVQGAFLTQGDGVVPVVEGSIATVSEQADVPAVNIYFGLDSPLVGSVTEAVVGSVPREGGVEPLSMVIAADNMDQPSQVLGVSMDDEGPSLSFIGSADGFINGAFIMLPEQPSYPLSLRVTGSNAELVNLSGVLGEQVGYAEPVAGIAGFQLFTQVTGAANIPLTPVLLFSEPLSAEVRTQLFNKLKDDFPAWN